ncbi:MAG: DMT family transporter [Planctomycetota bacterium]|jgi:drug/metabolite transporter (DMT)-like permease
MEKQEKAYLYAGIAVLLWSTAASAFKISLRHTDVVSLLFYASLTSTAVFFVHLLFSKKLNLLKGLRHRDYLHSALLGLLNPFLYYAVLFKAYSILPAQEAQPLNFVWPLTLVLLSIPLLGQKIGAKDIVATIISFVGVLIISTRGDILAFKFTDPLGVSLATGSSIIWALFWIYNIRDKRDEVIRLFLNFAFGSAFIFAAMLLSANVRFPTISGILGAMYVGLFEMGITFLLWLKALKLSKTTACHEPDLSGAFPFACFDLSCRGGEDSALDDSGTGLYRERHHIAETPGPEVPLTENTPSTAQTPSSAFDNPGRPRN